VHVPEGVHLNPCTKECWEAVKEAFDLLPDADKQRYHTRSELSAGVAREARREKKATAAEPALKDEVASEPEASDRSIVPFSSDLAIPPRDATRPLALQELPLNINTALIANGALQKPVDELSLADLGARPDTKPQDLMFDPQLIGEYFTTKKYGRTYSFKDANKELKEITAKVHLSEPFPKQANLGSL